MKARQSERERDRKGDNQQRERVKKSKEIFDIESEKPERDSVDK